MRLEIRKFVKLTSSVFALIAASFAVYAQISNVNYSYLYFNVQTAQPTATLNFVSLVEVTKANWNEELPVFIDSTGQASMTGLAGLPIFEFYTDYNLVETSTNETFALNIHMMNTDCGINGYPAGNPVFPLRFETEEWIYYVDLIKDASVPDNVSCSINVTSEEAPLPPVPTPTSVQIANQTNQGGQGSGTLGTGIVTMTGGTTCSATPDCSTVAQNGVAPGAISALYTFIPSGSGELNGVISYPITNDPDLEEQHSVNVTIKNGRTISERCEAIISPPTTGKAIYSTAVVPLNENSCQVNVTRTKQPISDSPSMQVVINNQVCGAPGAGNACGPGTGEYTFALEKGQTETPIAGHFNPEGNLLDITGGQGTVVTTTLSTEDGPGSPYNGSFHYVFDDYISNSVPIGLDVNLINSSSDMQDWCEAAITGVNQGYRTYTVSTHVVDNGHNAATCTISITANASTPPPTYAFKQIQTLKTEGIRNWEAFTIGSGHYLIADNAASVEPGYVTTNMFKFDTASNKFLDYDMVFPFKCIDSSGMAYDYTNHIYNWKHFKFDNVDRLIMANNYSYFVYQGACEESQNWTKSYILDWKDNKFFDDQDLGKFPYINTDTALMWEDFTTYYNDTTKHYLIVAEEGKANTSFGAVYYWNGSGFEKTASFNGAEFVQPFSIAGQQYLVVSDGDSSEVTIYYIDANGAASVYQNGTDGYMIGSKGVKSVLVFSQDNKQGDTEYFLALTYKSGTSNTPIIYRWENKNIGGDIKSVFVPYQSLQGSAYNFANVHTWTAYSINDKNYLAAAFGTGGAYAFEWNNDVQQLVTTGGYPIWKEDAFNIQSLTSLVINNNLYVALGVTDNKGNVQTTSPIMQWKVVSQ